MYAAKEVRQGIRRATPARIAAAATAIDSYLTERSDVQVGDMVRTHWAIRQARQPEGAEVSLPSNATFRQMQHLDAMRSPGREGGHQEGGFRTLTVRLNVSSEMQLTIDIQEVETAAGLPQNVRLPLAPGTYECTRYPLQRWIWVWARVQTRDHTLNKCTVETKPFKRPSCCAPPHKSAHITGCQNGDSLSTCERHPNDRSLSTRTAVRYQARS
ncbi:hypothetical protein GN958_ATG20298 [Phytophthora infestans]|uniref:Uncharacterized protein n=1 Tax=Phytophthora infestans TaxID=4787 RepID=A0A8S9TNK1_PHYIN|nr:hypothetical protein GN958_ATG20298 [Phytophthora infestans]